MDEFKHQQQGAVVDTRTSEERALAALQLEELKAKQQKRLVRQYRRHKRRVLVAKSTKKVKGIVSKAKTAYTPWRAVITGIVLVVFGAGLWFMTARGYQQLTTKHNKSHITPDFKPAVPNNDVNATTSENNNFKIVNYQDSYKGTALVVSQQKLPDAFSRDPSTIRTLDQFKDADEVSTPKGKLYLTTNKTGQQWGAMVYGNILLFIQTSKTMPDADWSAYISSLQVK